MTEKAFTPGATDLLGDCIQTKRTNDRPEAAAVSEESGLLAQLTDRADSKPSALAQAKAMLTGTTPAPRQDRDGLQVRLNTCRERIALLVQAIDEQRQVLSGLVTAQSAVVNAEAKQGHTKAVQGIKTALTGLHEAMTAEASIRNEIESSGYQCSLPPIGRPLLNFADGQSELSRFAREVDAFLLRCEIEGMKTATIRLLADTPAEAVGDVLNLPGIEAAALVHMGQAELTTAKPNRTLAERIGEVVFS